MLAPNTGTWEEAELKDEDEDDRRIACRLGVPNRNRLARGLVAPHGQNIAKQKIARGQISKAESDIMIIADAYGEGVADVTHIIRRKLGIVHTPSLNFNYNVIFTSFWKRSGYLIVRQPDK